MDNMKPIEIAELSDKITNLRHSKNRDVSVEALQILEECGGLIKLLEEITNGDPINDLRNEGLHLLQEAGLYQFIYTYFYHGDNHFYIDDSRIKSFLNGVNFANGKEWIKPIDNSGRIGFGCSRVERLKNRAPIKEADADIDTEEF